MPKDITHHHLVMPAELNHNGTLFGGAAMAAADKAAFICASLAFPDANFVTKSFSGFDFHHPAKAGDILSLNTQILERRTTSLTIEVKAENAKTNQPIFSTQGVFVNVMDGRKHPLNT